MAGYRCIGCAELAICYVACGRAAGYISQNIHVWDFSAGKIIVEESGGCLLNKNQNEIDIQNTNRVFACSLHFRDVLFKINNAAESNRVN